MARGIGGSMARSGDYRDKVVVITGASSGIGAELARQLARQGAKLVLGSIDADGLKAVAAECAGLGAEATHKEINVAEERDCKAFIQHAVNTFGRIDVLVNNAGISMWSTLEELADLDVIRRVMDVNFFGSVYCTYYALKHVKASAGQIVVTNSEAGRTGVPTRTGYSASKFALRGFFDALRIELASSGVAITSVYPGFVSTGLHAHFLGPDGKPVSKTDVIDQGKIMTTQQCVERIVAGMRRRKREVVFSARARATLWGNVIAPGIVDRRAARAISTGR